MAELRPGDGSFFEVRIEAIADRSPGNLLEPSSNPTDELHRLITHMQRSTEQELIDQVYRKLTIYLCRPCFRTWIDNPTG